MKIHLRCLSFLVFFGVMTSFTLRAQDCFAPQGNQVSNITQTTATISWDAGFDVAWYVIVSNSIIQNPVPAQATRVENSSYAATALSPQTTYYYSIATICSDSVSEWTTGMFQTRCLATNTPYSEDFETYGTGGNAFPSCWTKVQSSYNNYPYLTNINNSLGSMIFKNSVCLAAMQEMTEDVSLLRVTFSARSESTTAGMEIGIMNDVTNPDDFTPVDTVYVSLANTFENVEVHLNTYSGNGKYIAFRYTQSERFYIDDVVVSHIPTCLNPVSLSVSNITTQRATISWTTVGSPTALQALISTTPISDFTGQNPFTVYNQQYTATSLSANTTYYFYIQAVCGEDLSDWNSITFTTSCSSTFLPSSEEFATLSFPACWSTQHVTGMSDIIISDYGYNPLTAPADGIAMVAWNSVNFSDGVQSRLVSLPLTTIGENGIAVDFAWRHSNLAPEALNEGVQLQYSFDGINWTNASENMLRRYSDVYNSWTNYSVTIPEVANHSTVYIGFLFTAARGANCYLDEITFNHVASCMKPVAHPAENVSGNSADLSWTEIGNATSWNLIISDTIVHNFQTTPSITVTDTFYTPASLNPMTTYYYYVQSRCGTNDLSEWSNIQYFTTSCGSIYNFPYTENFDSYGTCSDAFPPCWSRPMTYNYFDFNNSTSCTTPSATGLHAVSSPASMLFVSPSGNFTYAVSPPISSDIQQVMISLFLWKDNSIYSGHIDIGVMSNPTDMATFETIATLNPDTAQSWTYYQLFCDQATLSGANNYIAIRHQAVSDYDYYLVDNVTIDLIPSCWHAINPTVTEITGSTATLHWDDNNSDNHTWHLKISDYALQNLSGIGNVIDTFINTNTFTINHLSGDTHFYYYLQAVCGGDDASRWTTGNFTTSPCNCFVKINMNDLGNNGWNGGQIALYLDNELVDVATLADGSTGSAFLFPCAEGMLDFRWESGNADNEITYSIENHNGEVLYTSAGTPSAGSFFTHVNDCGSSCNEIPTNLSASNFNQGATLSWDGTPNATSYSVYKNGLQIAAWIPNTTYIDTTLVTGEVCYTVKAVCVKGESVESNNSCITGIASYETNNLLIFPNPAHEQFEIHSDFIINEIRITNAIGQQICHLSANDKHAILHTENWQNGMYFVAVKTDNHWQYSKIMVIK